MIRPALSCAALILMLSSGPACADIFRSVTVDGVTRFVNVSQIERDELFLKKHPDAIPSHGASRLGGRRADSKSPYASSIQAAGRVSDVDPALIHAVILAESGYDPSARSRKGAVGLMQLMPETAERYGVLNRLDPAQNIRGGTRYLRDLLRMFNNDLRLALAAYNAGEGAVAKYGNRIPPFPETIAYVPRVIAQYRRNLAKS
jgi:soluble lytic murein transglycosylase-like protein